MNPTRALHLVGQRLRLDDITRHLLEEGTLKRAGGADAPHLTHGE